MDDLAKLITAGQRGGEDSCGDFGIRIAKDGTWYYRGTPIGRKRLAKLFSTVLRKDEAGEYWLVTPVERGRIEVEDAPFVAVALDVAGEGRDQTLTLRTNLDEIVAVDSAHPLRIEEDSATGEPRPYVLVRDNLEALVARSVFYELVERAVDAPDGNDHVIGVWSRGTFFPLGRAESPS